jgi:hypothetical protein
MPSITTKGGAQIFYKDWGQGQPIVFHHGWPPSADDRVNQMMFFPQRGYRVIAHDRQGHDGPASRSSVTTWIIVVPRHTRPINSSLLTGSPDQDLDDLKRARQWEPGHHPPAIRAVPNEPAIRRTRRSGPGPVRTPFLFRIGGSRTRTKTGPWIRFPQPSDPPGWECIGYPRFAAHGSSEALAVRPGRRGRAGPAVDKPTAA